MVTSLLVNLPILHSVTLLPSFFESSLKLLPPKLLRGDDHDGHHITLIFPLDKSKFKG